MATTVYVDFADETQQVIVATFSNPQDSEHWKNQGEVTTSDERYADYYHSEQVQMLIAMNITLPEPTTD